MNATHKNSMDNAYKTARDAADTAAETARDGAKAVVRGVEGFSTAAQRKVEDVSDAISDKAKDVAHDVADATEGGKNGVGKVLQSAQEAARSSKDALVSGAGSTLGSMRDVAMEKPDEARETLSDVGDRIAATLERASHQE